MGRLYLRAASIYAPPLFMRCLYLRAASIYAPLYCCVRIINICFRSGWVLTVELCSPSLCILLAFGRPRILVELFIGLILSECEIYPLIFVTLSTLPTNTRIAIIKVSHHYRLFICDLIECVFTGLWLLQHVFRRIHYQCWQDGLAGRVLVIVIVG